MKAHVSGVVHAPAAGADERREDDRPVTRLDLLAATGAEAVVDALEVARAPAPSGD